MKLIYEVLAELLGPNNFVKFDSKLIRRFVSFFIMKKIYIQYFKYSIIISDTSKTTLFKKLNNRRDF